MSELFRDLTKKEKVELFTAWLDGVSIEFRSSMIGLWYPAPHPKWHGDKAYRIKKDLPSINWDHVSKKYNWLAVDKNGEAWFYTGEPFVYTGSNIWSCKSGETTLIVGGFSSFKEGNCSWRESLIKRPMNSEE